MKKILPIILGIAAILIIGGGVWMWLKGQKPAEKKTIAPPPSVKKVNELELEKRPFVALLPHPNPGRCNGVDLIIENLQNQESLAEYELEYTAGPLIQGVFGRRDFSQVANTHQPLEFGSCSKGKCKCDTGISGGSLTLTFTTPSEEYALKSDFSLYEVGEDEVFTSTDARLQVEPGRALATGTQVIVMKSMGLPSEIDGEVVVGPYGLFGPQGVTAKVPMEASLQTQEEGKLMFWNGRAWEDLEVEVDGKLSFELPGLGVVALVR